MNETQAATKTYDRLLEEARNEARKYRETACRLIPKMYYVLRQEEHLSKSDARDRIEKDCIEFWSKRTILNSLPDECKDPEKRKGAEERKKLQERFPQIVINDAAESAATALVGNRDNEEALEGKVLIDENEYQTLKMRVKSLNKHAMDVSLELQETRRKLKQKEEIVDQLLSEPSGRSQKGRSTQTTLDKFMPALKEIVHIAHSEKCPSGCSTWKKARRIKIAV